MFALSQNLENINLISEIITKFYIRNAKMLLRIELFSLKIRFHKSNASEICILIFNKHIVIRVTHFQIQLELENAFAGETMYRSYKQELNWMIEK